jgi:hypothetical protein
MPGVDTLHHNGRRWLWVRSHGRRESGFFANMTSHSRGAMHPRFARKPCPMKIRGRREDRVRAAPAVSRAMCIKKCAHEHTGSAENTRPSLRNGFTAYFVLAPVTGFLATVISKITSANLTPAPGRQAHTTSPYALVSFVRISSSRRHHRVHRSLSLVCDDGLRPLVGQDGGS